MKIDYSALPLEQLERMYQDADAKLRQALLNGASWEEAKAQRDVVTEIAVQLHKRKYPLTGTPADTPFRRS